VTVPVGETTDTLVSIRTRYACRAYSDRPVPPQLVRTIVEAGLAAPSALNRQPWRLIVVTRPEALAALERAGLAAARRVDPPGYERIMRRGGTLLYNSRALIIVAQQRLDSPFPPAMDVGIVASHLALAARSLGVDSVIAAMPGYAFAGDDAPALKQLLGMPDDFDFGIAVLLGYAVEAGAPHEPDPAKIIEVV